MLAPVGSGALSAHLPLKYIMLAFGASVSIGDELVKVVLSQM